MNDSKIQTLLAQYSQAQAALGNGCSDGYCVVKRPRGQHTNGGCRCMYNPDHLTAQRAGQIMRLAQDMAALLEEINSREEK